MQTALIIIHVVIAVILTAIVLMQHGKQQGLSGAIAGGAETFFGKNKGRTVDAMLKKFTAVVAILFIISSVILTTVSVKKYNAENTVSESETKEDGGQTMNVSVDENGNLVDESGNIVMTAEQMQEQQAAQEAEGTADGTAADTQTADDTSAADASAADTSAVDANAADANAADASAAGAGTDAQAPQEGQAADGQ